MVAQKTLRLFEGKQTCLFWKYCRCIQMSCNWSNYLIYFRRKQKKIRRNLKSSSYRQKYFFSRYYIKDDSLHSKSQNNEQNFLLWIFPSDSPSMILACFYKKVKVNMFSENSEQYFPNRTDTTIESTSIVLLTIKKTNTML